MTLAVVCHEVPYVGVDQREGSDHKDNFGLIIKNTDDIAQPLGEVWSDELPTYRDVEYDYRYIVHDDRYVSSEGVGKNQAERF